MLKILIAGIGYVVLKKVGKVKLVNRKSRNSVLSNLPFPISYYNNYCSIETYSYVNQNESSFNRYLGVPLCPI